ncbi:MAG: BlaI/MecI/CopY family transcriptional regulator [Solirubrobacterales bacterium]|nr:BlaI/MecI/CopY family transcriptional regulator [Solirubrobacterales bacterium]
MTPRKKSPPPPLHELESEVMEEMWQREDATVREVLEALNQGPKQRAYTTVMTIMVRLDRKGLLRRRRRGKSDVYRPTLPRAEYLDARARTEVAALLEQYGDVALGHFANQVEALDPERLEQLRSLARRD